VLAEPVPPPHPVDRAAIAITESERGWRMNEPRRMGVKGYRSGRWRGKRTGRGPRDGMPPAPRRVRGTDRGNVAGPAPRLVTTWDSPTTSAWAHTSPAAMAAVRAYPSPFPVRTPD